MGRPLTPGGISAMAFFYLWVVFFMPSWGGTPWVVNSEMFEQGLRTLAQAFAAANKLLWNFVIVRFTPHMFETMDYGVYFFFGSLMLCSVAFVYFLLPETRGISLEAVDHLFAPGKHARYAHKVVLLELKAAEEIIREGIEGDRKVNELDSESCILA